MTAGKKAFISPPKLSRCLSHGVSSGRYFSFLSRDLLGHKNRAREREREKERPWSTYLKECNSESIVVALPLHRYICLPVSLLCTLSLTHTHRHDTHPLSLTHTQRHDTHPLSLSHTQRHHTHPLSLTHTHRDTTNTLHLHLHLHLVI